MWVHPWVGKISWRRAQQPTPVFMPGEPYGEPYGQRNLAGYSPQGRKESDTTEATQHTCTIAILPILHIQKNEKFFSKVSVYFWLSCIFVAVWASSSCSEPGLLFIAVSGLLISVSSLVAEHGLQGVWASVVAAGRLCCCSTRAQFP